MLTLMVTVGGVVRAVIGRWDGGERKRMIVRGKGKIGEIGDKLKAILPGLLNKD